MSEIVGHIPGRAAHVRVQGEVPLRPLDEVARFGKSELEAATFIAPRETACMVPMQVRCDDGVDIVGSNPDSLQRPKQTFWLTQCYLLCPLFAELRADACLANNDAAILAGDEADTRAVDHVVSVGRLLLLPKDLRDHAEHQAAIGFPMPGDEDV